MHTDCYRDFEIAKELGFSRMHVGVIPGGTGYKLEETNLYKLPLIERKIILVKGYEHNLGRGLNVIKALESIIKNIQKYDVVVFGAHQKVIDYIKTNQLNFEFFGRHELSHQELMQLMGKSLFYIGNSISDGMPNTLLEAIAMGAFPMQSNPGKVTEEIIENGVNGLLINNAESIDEIKGVVLKAISYDEILQSASKKNHDIAIEKLEYSVNKKKVIQIYNLIAQCE